MERLQAGHPNRLEEGADGTPEGDGPKRHRPLGRGSSKGGHPSKATDAIEKSLDLAEEIVPLAAQEGRSFLIYLYGVVAGVACFSRPVGGAGRLGSGPVRFRDNNLGVSHDVAVQGGREGDQPAAGGEQEVWGQGLGGHGDGPWKADGKPFDKDDLVEALLKMDTAIENAHGRIKSLEGILRQANP